MRHEPPIAPVTPGRALSRSGIAPAASATPRPEPPTDRDHRVPRCHCGAEAHGTDPHGAPACATHATRESLAERLPDSAFRRDDLPRADTGTIRGAAEKASVTRDGAGPWNWLPPGPGLDPTDHCDSPIVIGCELRYQPAQPVHVPGAVTGAPREQRRHLRQISEAEAERRALALALGAVATQASTTAAVAALAGVTPQRVARARNGQAPR